MPKKKDLKRLTRSRMRKTGEAYTTARARLLEKKRRQTTPDYPALAGFSDRVVRARTGRTWEQWVEWLDKQKAAEMPHRQIAELVHSHFEISGWWAQMVTVGYERIKGLREIGQRRGGSYDINKSKTVQAPIAKLYRAFSVARTRKRWLGDVGWEVRKATPEKSIRVTWEDGTWVDVYFYARGEAKSQVTVQHRKLGSKAEAEKMKAFWSDRLSKLPERVR